MKKVSITITILIILGLSVLVQAQTSTFTYQGRLNDNSLAAQGTYEMQFLLFDAVAGGTQIGSTIENTSVSIVNGVFTVQLDFGANAFNGSDRFIEIAVRRNSGESYAMLNPRQPITSAPYSVKSQNATNADLIDGIDTSQLIQEGDSRLTDAREANSINLNTATVSGVVPITNGGTGSATQNFVDTTNNQTNIAGNKTFTGTISGNAVNAATQYNIGGNRVLSIGTSNLSVGKDAGRADIGNSNTFVGNSAGSLSQGGGNSFIGAFTGSSNTGDSNSFFGNSVGSSNTTGSNNTLFGTFANVGSPNLVYATAIGSGATVSRSNSLVLGHNFNTGVNVGIGTDSPLNRLHIVLPPISGNQWGIRLHNLSTAFVTGMRVANSGFFEVTNNLTNSSPNFARLDSGGNWTAVSDARLKQNIFTLSDLLDKTLRLRPVGYTFKSNPTVSQIGFIAQEVEAIFPEFVTGGNGENEMKTLNYSGLSVIAIGAIQEQQKIIKKQQAEIDSMKQFICSQNPSAPFCGKEEK